MKERQHWVNPPIIEVLINLTDTPPKRTKNRPSKRQRERRKRNG